MNVKEFLNQKVMSVLRALGYADSVGLVNSSCRSDLSDYQSTVAMALAKIMKKSPMELAHHISALLSSTEELSQVTVDGPGFINMTLSDNFLLRNLSEKLSPISHKKVMIDYGGANIAKEMHVGHLRPAIVGESIKRIMRACGDEVIADVHLGDWGTPMGMLIAQLKKERPDLPFFKEDVSGIRKDSLPMTIGDISELYKRAAQAFREDDDFKEQARIATAQLQNQHEGYLALWKSLKDVSVADIKKNYDALSASFDYWLGESDVNELLPNILDDLLQRNLAVESEDAIVIFLPEKNGQVRPPVILKKSDGAYTYAATDLATILQRMNQFHPDAILYVVDSRQKDHFEQVFEVAKLAGYAHAAVSLEHIAIGTIKGPDGKPFKTRSGESVKFNDLLTIAKEGARANLPEASAEYSQETLEQQADCIAIAAIKYQDLKNNLASHYIFDTENFVKAEGKTGPYLQYAVARINSILVKAKELHLEASAHCVISHPLERELILLLEKQPEILQEAYERREPSVIAEYVYLLAQKFSSFYAEVPVLGEEDTILRSSRLNLITLIKRTLLYHLNLLAIEAPERMLKRT